MRYLTPLVVLAIVVAGFAYYALFLPATPDIGALQREAAMSQPAESTNPPAAEPTRASILGEGSLYSLLTRGDSLECQITYIPNPVEAEVVGSFFTNAGSARGDFIVPTPDLSGQMVSSIIITDNTIWQWSDIDGELVGSKQAADLTTDTLERLLSPVGFTTTVQYDCLTWPSVDQTIFEPPSSVTFTDAAEAVFEEGIIYESEESEL